MAAQTSTTTRRAKPKTEPVATPEDSIEDLIDEAQLPERTVQVCLRGDLWAQVELLDHELTEMAIQTDGRLVGNTAARDLADRIEALRAKMARSTKPFVFRALPPGEFTTLEALHPPRPNDERDRLAGHNRDDFIEALIKGSLFSPVISEAYWGKLLVKISQRQYDEIANAAWLVNKGEISVPFSQAASKVRSLGLASKRPNASASPSADSTDGNLAA